MTLDLYVHRFTRTEVLAITKLRKELLQTWVNRGVIALGDQNPGSGRRRLYSAMDIVKLAILRRIADLNLALDIGRDLVAIAESELVDVGAVEWNRHQFISRHDATHRTINVEFPDSSGAAVIGDAADMRVSKYTEPFEDLVVRRDRGPDGFRPINEARRLAAARAGFHAEPVVVFPLGEIVNGALAQIEALRDGPLPSIFEAMKEVPPPKRVRPWDKADAD